LGTLRKKKNPLSPVVGLLIADESVCDPGKSIASIVASATALKACTRVPFLWNALQNAQSFVCAYGNYFPPFWKLAVVYGA
jgi:hypothetical protein